MIFLRCDRCSKELPNPTFFASGGQHIGVILYKTGGWENFAGQSSMAEPHNNKHICPECAHEYYFGFLKTKPGTENGQ